MADQPITTSIDDLVKYVHEHGETDSNTLAAALNVGEAIIEKWTDVLEKAQIVKVSYKLGKMYAAPLLVSQEAVESASKTAEMKKGIVESELAAQVDLVNQINSRLDEFKRYVGGAESAFKSKAGAIKNTIDEIDRLGMQVDNAYKKMASENEYMDKLGEKMDEQLQALQKKAEAASAYGVTQDSSKQISDDLRLKLADYENRLKALDAGFGATLKQKRQEFAELSDSIREEQKAMHSVLDQEERAGREYERALESYRHDSESMRKQAERERSRIMDDMAKSADEVRKAYDVSGRQAAEARKQLDELKSHFGGYAELSDKLNDVKSSIESISREKEELQTELGQLSEQLRAISALGESQAGDKSAKISQAVKRVAATSKGAQKLAGDVKNVRKKIDDVAKK